MSNEPVKDLLCLPDDLLHSCLLPLDWTELRHVHGTSPRLRLLARLVVSDRAWLEQVEHLELVGQQDLTAATAAVLPRMPRLVTLGLRESPAEDAPAFTCRVELLRTTDVFDAAHLSEGVATVIAPFFQANRALGLLGIGKRPADHLDLTALAGTEFLRPPCQLGVAASIIFARVLESRGAPRLQTLDLSGDGALSAAPHASMGDAGAVALAAALAGVRGDKGYSYRAPVRQTAIEQVFRVMSGQGGGEGHDDGDGASRGTDGDRSGGGGAGGAAGLVTPALRTLVLTRQAIGDVGAVALAETVGGEWLPALEAVNLNHNPAIGAAGAAAQLESFRRRVAAGRGLRSFCEVPVRQLHAGRDGGGDGGVAACRPPWAPHLTTAALTKLDVHDRGLGEPALRVLAWLLHADSGGAPSLQELYLYCTPIPAASGAALAAALRSGGAPKLAAVHFDADDVDAAVQAELRDAARQRGCHAYF